MKLTELLSGAINQRVAQQVEKSFYPMLKTVSSSHVLKYHTFLNEKNHKKKFNLLLIDTKMHHLT